MVEGGGAAAVSVWTSVLRVFSLNTCLDSDFLTVIIEVLHAFTQSVQANDKTVPR
jgi:hypothetical protein